MTEHRTLVAVFLAVIALASLLQAAFVAALAIGLRMGDRKLAEAEGRFTADVLPRLGQLARAVHRAAELSERSVDQARRMDAALQETATRVEAFVDRASTRVERLAGRSAERLVEGVRGRAADSQVGRSVARAGAVARGVRQVIGVWQAYRVAREDVPPDGDDDETAIPSPD